MGQTNLNSLANLRLPKDKKEGHGYRYAVPREKIDELFSYIASGMGIKAAAKESGMSFPTASKYFKQGDASRGIKPLKIRLAVFQERISEKMNVLLEEQIQERLLTVRNLIKKTETELTSEEYEGKVSIRDLERLIKLEAFLCGGVTVKEHEKKMLTADEING